MYDIFESNTSNSTGKYDFTTLFNYSTLIFSKILSTTVPFPYKSLLAEKYKVNESLS